ncbi:MAG: decaprenyl-phosphate phosphoribosyltransferase, partial [Ignavibacteria bacterium]
MLKKYITLIRISHWIKNSLIFVPLIFSKHLFMHDQFILALMAFFSFSFLASSIYIINDIADVERDRQHPLKRKRPIASGEIGKSQALVISFILLILSVLIALSFDYRFVLALAGYFVLNILYSFLLKQIVILDLISIAIGFLLRVFAGAIAIDVSISKWLILATLFISLFLAVMKRRSEIINIDPELNTRKVLEDYSLEFINHFISITASSVIICYALYTVSS